MGVDNWSSATVNRLSPPQISFSFIQVLPRSKMTSELTKEQKDQFEKLFYSFDTDKDVITKKIYFYINNFSLHTKLFWGNLKKYILNVTQKQNFSQILQLFSNYFFEA